MGVFVIVKMQSNKIKTELSEHHPEQQQQSQLNQAGRKEEGSTCVDNKQSMNTSQQTRITFTYATHPLPLPPSAVTIQTVVYPQQEVIYYPVIHNKLVLSPSPDKHLHPTPTTATATGRKHTPSAHPSTPARKLPAISDQVLTPQQFRKLSQHASK